MPGDIVCTMRFAVIMAGGAGTRLWPLSRKGTPKQLLRLIDGKSLLRIAFERLGDLVPPERVLICTGAPYADQVRADLVSVGVKTSKATVTGLLSQAHDHAERVALERDLAAEVADQGLPTLRLPALPTGVEDGGITVLADALTAQGVR